MCFGKKNSSDLHEILYRRWSRNLVMVIMSFEEVSIVKSHTFLMGVNDLLSVHCTFIAHLFTANRRLVFESMNSVTIYHSVFRDIFGSKLLSYDKTMFIIQSSVKNFWNLITVTFTVIIIIDHDKPFEKGFWSPIAQSAPWLND